MEINATVPLALSDPVSADAYDLQSMMTHESGHFLGLAHTPDMDASMWAYQQDGSTSKRILAVDDMAGICAIYLPNGSRAAETWTSADDAGWTVDLPAVHGRESSSNGARPSVGSGRTARPVSSHAATIEEAQAGGSRERGHAAGLALDSRT
jgi:hypothetical protein